MTGILQALLSFFGVSTASSANYIEDVFSTYLYTGNGSTQTITNDIDLSGKGGLVWLKGRSGATDHALYDTVRGATFDLVSNSPAAQTTQSTGLTAFNSNGFSLGALAKLNTNAATYASWTFREQAKFFDVVTWSGDGTGNRTIPHNLGSVPGFIQPKRTNASEPWWNHHRSVTSPNANWWRNYGLLDGTNAFADWGDDGGLYQAPDATNLYIGSYYNASGKTYVAYLFAHDAGGFGASGTDNVITCGSYTGTSGVDTVTLGYEPQWILIKRSSGTSPWWLVDNMRGMSWGSNTIALSANTSGAENTDPFPDIRVRPTATGFQLPSDGSEWDGSGSTYIYIAIRRGPMKTPTSGTSVFTPETSNGSAPNASLIAGAASAGDMYIMAGSRTSPTTPPWLFADRLRGFSSTTGFPILNSQSTAAEVSRTTSPYMYMNSGDNRINFVPSSGNLTYKFCRSPGFMDVVCYTGTGATRTVAHNLGVVPELIIVKARANARNWTIYSSTTGNAGHLILNDASAYEANASDWENTSPTASVFTVGGNYTVNDLNAGMVAYLFATVAGVSKVGSYTGTGTTQVINCGFTAGARFVMIKRTDSTGDWYVWDSARGIVAGNDPYLLLNSTAAEVTNTDYVDTANSGFEISSTAPAEINANGGTFIFLAIA